MLKFIRNMKFSLKIAVVMTSLILGIVLTLVISILSINRIFNSYERSSSYSFSVLKTINEMNSSFLKIRGDIYKCVYIVDEDNKKELIKSIEKEVENINEKINNYSNYKINEEERVVFEEYRILWKDFCKDLNLQKTFLLNSSNNLGYKAVLDSFMHRIDRKRQEVETLLNKLAEYKKSEVDNSLKTERNYFKHSLVLMVVFTLAIIAVCVAFILVIMRGIVTNVIQGKKLARALKAGDLTVSCTSKSADEIGVMISDLDISRNSMRNLVSHVYLNAEKVNGSTEKLTEAAKKASEAINEIVSVVTNLTDEVNNQNDQSRKVFKLMEELAFKIEDVSEKCKEINEITHENLKITETGLKISDELFKRTSQVMNTSDVVYKNVHNLEDISKEIWKITKVISNLTKQTDMLSLNATIEAAKAGRYGKSFAVVADEINKLSIQTGNSSKEIGTLISNIQNQVNKTVNAVNNIKRINDEQFEIVKENNEYYKKMTSSNRMIINNLEKLNYSLNEINSSKEEVVNSIGNIASSFECFSASFEEVMASTEEHNRVINNVAKSTIELKDEAYSLKKRIEEFKV